MSFLTAISFLTTLRVPRRGGTGDMSGAASLFPAVGIIIGLVLAGSYWLLIRILPAEPVSAIVIVLGVVLSGGAHLEGLADTCDGIGGHKDTEARLRVMHDSRSGAFGIIGIVCLLLVKYAALSSIPGSLVIAALLIMPVISRWTMVYAIFAYPYARPAGLGRTIKEGLGRGKFAIATVITVAAVIGMTAWMRIPLFYLAGPLVMLGVWLVALAMSAYLKGKLSGLTGDTYGAINEVAEVSALIMILILAFNLRPL